MRRVAMSRGPQWQGRDAGVGALDHAEGRRRGRPVESGAWPGSGPSESGVERRGARLTGGDLVCDSARLLSMEPWNRSLVQRWHGCAGVAAGEASESGR